MLNNRGKSHIHEVHAKRSNMSGQKIEMQESLDHWNEKVFVLIRIHLYSRLHVSDLHGNFQGEWTNL